MAHKTFDELSLTLRETAKHLKIGGLYAHYKHPESHYCVLGLVILEATDEVAVRYVSVENKAIEFIRPLISWQDTVETERGLVPRFTRVKS